MKKLISLFAIICVIAAAGCSNGNNGAQTTTKAVETTTTAADTTTAAVSEDEDGKKSQVVYEAEEKKDTTEEALAYLAQKVPLFKQYLDMRRTVPLTFETTVTTDKGDYKTGIYIKDAENFAQYSKDPEGNETTVLYMKDTAYQVDTESRTVLTYNCGESEVKAMSDSLRVATIDLDEVEGSTYDYTTGEMNGKTYYKITISMEGTDDSIMYFDPDTSLLAYSVVGDSVSRVDKFENTFTNEDIFKIPEDYEVHAFEDILAEAQAQAQSELEDSVNSIESESSSESE